MPALIVTSGEHRYAIPQVNLLELVRLEGDQAGTGIEDIYGSPVYRLRGKLLPLVYLHEALGGSRERSHANGASPGAANVVVLQADDRQFGLVVDDINDTEEIVVKPLGKELKELAVYAGATIMGDGRVALILDVVGLAQHAGAISAMRERAAAEQAERDAGAAGGPEKRTVLIFGVGHDAIMAVPLSAVSRLEEIPRERVERAGSRLVVQYRGHILPLVDLASIFSVGFVDGSEEPPVLQVIVYSDGLRSVGFIVSTIVDIVDDVVNVEEGTAHPGVLGAAVVQGHVTEMLDVDGLLRAHAPAPLAGRAA